VSLTRKTIFALILLACHQQAEAALPAGVNGGLDLIETTAPARPTAAWTAFCRINPSECQIDLSEPSRIHLTQTIWNLLERVNTQVNRAITPMTDKDHWGVDDRWDFAEDGIGDCEDFQLVKRRRLIAAGLPRRALRMTVVVDETGSGHAVLSVMTDRGAYILDNRHPLVLPWTGTGYHFVKREGSTDATWVALADAPETDQ
jgi:predicted transglutaminase-like cysteine proteinase